MYSREDERRRRTRPDYGALRCDWPGSLSEKSIASYAGGGISYTLSVSASLGTCAKDARTRPASTCAPPSGGDPYPAPTGG